MRFIHRVWAQSIAKGQGWFLYGGNYSIGNADVYTSAILHCKMLVGKSQTLELHPLDAGLVSLNENVYGSNTLSAIGKQLFPVKKENSDD